MTRKRIAGGAGYYIVAVLLAVVALVPFAWMISTSLKSRGALMSIPIEWIPAEPTLDAYGEVFSRFPDVSSVQWSDPERYRCIYGGDIGLVGYWDAHDASRGGPDVSVSDGWTITRFIFNEDDRVYKIEIWASVD